MTTHLTKEPKISDHTFRQFMGDPEAQKTAIDLLLEKDGFVSFDSPWTHDESWVAFRKRLHRATALFSDGSTVELGLKEGDLEGPFREAIGVEVAQWLGLPLYEAIGGFDWLVFESLPGSAMSDVQKGVQYAKSIGYHVPYMRALGYSDMKEDHVIIGPNGATIIDWGTSFAYAPLADRRMGLVTDIEKMPEATQAYREGVQEGQASFLEHYNRHDTRKTIGLMMDSLREVRGVDRLVSSGNCVPNLSCWDALIKNAKKRMDGFASDWDGRKHALHLFR
jgi:hypothetical protein